LGKTLSYTVLGGLCGLAGSLITFTPTMKGAAAIAASIFLMGFGLNMLHLLPHLRCFGFTMPRWLSRFVHAEFRKHHSPFAIGLLNGLMIACGPLQAMYVMAAGTGSPWEGARVLLLFGAGTLPLLLGFGFLTSLISHQTSDKLLKASGLIVVALGLIMLNRGLILTGSGYDFRSLSAWISTATDVIAERYDSSQTQNGIYQTIRMEVTREGFQPANFVLRKGNPVRWIIIGKELTECNRSIIVPKLGLQFDVQLGEQVIEFVPKDDGIILWSCWMGMIRGTFMVVDTPSTPVLTRPENKTTAEQPSWSFRALWQRLAQRVKKSWQWLESD
jgi:sulfite exporter TauE/SafE